ncbi:radical SAM protein [Desulfosediminicola flagellatus]|uniref:radical SAM protein n=1 Tax=Desulfosediminicola flagellatus TaxID=2569541 RepID=UPI0010AD5D3C|nr:radical SAM protein [Desulfosediminicola flagellatus]
MVMTEAEIVEKYRQLYPAIPATFLDKFTKSAAVRATISRKLCLPAPIFTDAEIIRPVPPFFLDLEITTSCQLSCRYCARTFMKVSPKHMSFQLFREILAANPNVAAINLVGLGEPLLHPELERILNELKKRKIRTSLVTNAMALNATKARMLIECGLSSITFSLDSTDHERFEWYREGADLTIILDNIREFMALRKSEGSTMTASIFSVLQADTLPGLGALAKFARSVNIPAIVISDLNFMENSSKSIRSDINRETVLTKILEQMREVAKQGIVLLGPNILDSVNMAEDWPTSILKKPEQIIKKIHSKHRYCLAPLRTLVVRVDGDTNYCNCTPETSAGNITSRPVEEIWWDEGLQNFRNNLFFGPVPDCCQICPRLSD